MGTNMFLEKVKSEGISHLSYVVGHGISGTLQLIVSSWVAVLCFFAGGVIATQLLFVLFGVN